MTPLALSRRTPQVSSRGRGLELDHHHLVHAFTPICAKLQRVGHFLTIESSVLPPLRHLLRPRHKSNSHDPSSISFFFFRWVQHHLRKLDARRGRLMGIYRGKHRHEAYQSQSLA